MRLNHSIRFESICFGVLNNFPLCRDCVCELSREQTTDVRRKGRFQSVAKRRMCWCMRQTGLLYRRWVQYQLRHF